MVEVRSSGFWFLEKTIDAEGPKGECVPLWVCVDSISYHTIWIKYDQVLVRRTGAALEDQRS